MTNHSFAFEALSLGGRGRGKVLCDDQVGVGGGEGNVPSSIHNLQTLVYKPTGCSQYKHRCSRVEFGSMFRDAVMYFSGIALS